LSDKFLDLTINRYISRIFCHCAAVQRLLKSMGGLLSKSEEIWFKYYLGIAALSLSTGPRLPIRTKPGHTKVYSCVRKSNKIWFTTGHYRAYKSPRIIRTRLHSTDTWITLQKVRFSGQRARTCWPETK
jgi:hypothetical protein